MEQSGQVSAQERRKKMEEILMGMQVKLGEIEQIRKDIHSEKYSGISSQTASMLEEVTIPEIEMLRDDRKKKVEH